MIFDGAAGKVWATVNEFLYYDTFIVLPRAKGRPLVAKSLVFVRYITHLSGVLR